MTTTRKPNPQPPPPSVDPQVAQKVAARLTGVTPAQARQILADRKSRLSKGARMAWATRRCVWAAEHLEHAAV